MLDASIGGAAARCRVYRHAIVQFMKPVLAVLQRGPDCPGWSLTLTAILMALQEAQYAAGTAARDLVRMQAH